MSKTKEKQSLKSMTGFAPLQGAIDGWSWNGEIRAVNGRSLDLRFRLPDIHGLEVELRKRVQARLGRGNVTVSLKLAKDETAQTFSVNPEGLQNALDAVSEIAKAAKEAGVEIGATSACDIALMKGVVDTSESRGTEKPEHLLAAILTNFDACLDEFDAYRAREGAVLAEVLNTQIHRLTELTQTAEQVAKDREHGMRKSLERSLARLLETTDVPDENRMMQELALIAVRTDVTEELDRLKSHIEGAKELMEVSEPVGRKFDFLMQEFNREANTLCSKSQSSELTSVGLELKATIDQLREQVQNIE